MKTRSAVLRRSGTSRPYEQSRPLEIEELDLAPPGPGELLVRIRAAGICHSDLSVIDGNRPRPLPMALGHEAAGEVVALGDGVIDINPGAHVVLAFVPSCRECIYCNTGRPALCARGAKANGAGELLSGGSRLRTAGGATVAHHLGVSAFSEHVVVDRSSAVVVPDSVPFETAALLGCAMLTGMGAVRNTAGVREDDTVCVLGLGGVGQAAVLGSVIAGAGCVIAVDPVEDKRELARSLGATHTAAPEDAEALVQSLTGGGVRWAFEAVGAAPVMEQAFRLLGRGGTAISVGLPAPDRSVMFPALAFAGEGKGFLGSYMGSSRPQEDVPDMIELWWEGRLPVGRLLTGALPLSRINEAFDALAEGTAVRQVVLP